MANPTLAPLLIGVTGKLDLKGADAAVRAAIDLAFERLDARCPGTPKVLLSALARGADTVAAEAALARPGWSVVAPLPFAEALYLDDFDAAGATKLKGLLADPRVRRLVIDPLRRSVHGEPVETSELHREPGGKNIARGDHYEQAGLFIAERAAILLAVMEAGEHPGKIGGTARIVNHRITGQLDAEAAGVVARSDVLVEPLHLVDRHTGPAWIVDLARLVERPSAPAAALLVWCPGEDGPSPLGDNRRTVGSLTLADSIELINRQIARRPAVPAESGPAKGDASSELRRLRRSLSAVQGDMVRRVRRSIWQLAGLSCLAILSFEISVDLGTTPMTRYFSLGYVAFIALAIALYLHAGRQRWQRIAEDYRAAAEAIRVQLVWWDCGLTGRGDRIGQYYLRGAHGSLQYLRTLITQLADACLLRFDPPKLDLAAAEAWVAGQVKFFAERIVSRRRELVVVDGASWFLFAASLSVGATLVVSQFSMVLLPLCATSMHWSVATRGLLIAGAAAAFGGLLYLAIVLRGGSDDHERDPTSLKAIAPVWVPGLIAGAVLVFGLCVLATLLPVPESQMTGKLAGELPLQIMKTARELAAIAVILPATIAGAFRFVADKSSWAAELAGYEHAYAHFRRGQAALAAAGPLDGPAADDDREIIIALGAEALAENENWLRSHRERPLEPVVGG